MESSIDYPANIFPFTLVSENLVGERHITSDTNHIVDLYVAHTGY
ncbi:hypothetical protein yaldo0001_7730 [Yersinia aldovae ATCC 35236]|nr:hypothetical protein yaldo0001_7730 [Yersinia aldovae ATCC 35236]